jgi:hypothetical protein
VNGCPPAAAVVRYRSLAMCSFSRGIEPRAAVPQGFGEVCLLCLDGAEKMVTALNDAFNPQMCIVLQAGAAEAGQ